MQRTKPPYRADHVGSFLRSAPLKEARAKREKGEISAAQAEAVELELSFRSQLTRRGWGHFEARLPEGRPFHFVELLVAVAADVVHENAHRRVPLPRRDVGLVALDPVLPAPGRDPESVDEHDGVGGRLRGGHGGGLEGGQGRHGEMERGGAPGRDALRRPNR